MNKQQRDFAITLGLLALISAGCFFLGMAAQRSMQISTDMLIGEPMDCTYQGDGSVTCEMRR